MEQLGSHWMDFHEILYLGIFQKSAEKIKVSSKSDGVTIHEDQYTFWITSRSVPLRMGNISKLQRKSKHPFYVQ
jgi:hypothetical protein